MIGPFLRKNKLFEGYNDPRLARRAVRLSRRHSERTGFAARLEDFRQKAEAFPNSPPLVIYTMVERGPITLPPLEDWEREFLEYQQDLEARNQAPLPPEAQALLSGLSMDEAFARFGGGGGGGGGKKGRGKKKGAAAKDGAGASSAEAPAGGADGDEEDEEGAGESGEDEILVQQATGPQDFGPMDPLMPQQGSEDPEADGSRWGARLSEADKLGDTRTLDRRYDHRLVLVVKEKDTGRWTLPHAARSDGGESMRAVAQRAIAASVSEELDAWVMGEFPLSVWLHEYSPEEQEAKGCLGEKRLFFRAEALDGRPRLDRDRFSDYQWLTRDEILAEGLLQRDGMGPGEAAPVLPGADAPLSPDSVAGLLRVPMPGGVVLAREAPDAYAARVHEVMGFSGAEWVERRRARALADGHATLPPTPFTEKGEFDGDGTEEEQLAKLKGARRKRARFATMTLPRPPRTRSAIRNRDAFLW